MFLRSARQARRNRNEKLCLLECLGEDECEGYSKGRVGRKNPSHSGKENLISFVKWRGNIHGLLVEHYIFLKKVSQSTDLKERKRDK